MAVRPIGAGTRPLAGGGAFTGGAATRRYRSTRGGGGRAPEGPAAAKDPFATATMQAALMDYMKGLAPLIEDEVMENYLEEVGTTVTPDAPRNREVWQKHLLAQYWQNRSREPEIPERYWRMLENWIQLRPAPKLKQGTPMGPGVGMSQLDVLGHALSQAGYEVPGMRQAAPPTQTPPRMGTPMPAPPSRIPASQAPSGGKIAGTPSGLRPLFRTASRLAGYLPGVGTINRLRGHLSRGGGSW